MYKLRGLVRSVDTYNPTALINKNRNSYVEVDFKGFFYRPAADRDTFVALVSPPERLGKVHRRAISRTPLPILQRGLLGEGEAGKLSLCLRPTHQQCECCLKMVKKRRQNRYERLARLNSLLHSPWPSVGAITFPAPWRALDPY
jgi:hypothetical protein